MSTLMVFWMMLEIIVLSVLCLWLGWREGRKYERELITNLNGENHET